MTEAFSVVQQRAAMMIQERKKELTRKLGNNAPEPTVVLTDDGYRGSGRLVVIGRKFDHRGLDLRIEVSSARNELEELNEVPDLVDVYLLRGTVNQEVRVLTIAVLQPSTEANHAVITVKYSLEDLCKLFKIKPPVDANVDTLKQLIRSECPQIAIRADWYGAKNNVFHYSGGADAKQGSGPIRLRTPTVKDFEDTEGVRNTNWNLAELLGPDRPVFLRFPELLVRDKQVATSLEVEAEYVADEGMLSHVVEAMERLAGAGKKQGELGVEALTKEVKNTLDHYYDLPGCPLLRQGFVLRHRSAKDDPTGTWLLAVKGRQVGEPGRQIRLTAQADLNGTVAASPEALRAFLADREADNPVARTLRHALGNTFDDLIAKHAPTKLFELEATRTRYTMRLADAVVVEFSADATAARTADRSARLHSFEFGLAHPGLYVEPGTSSSGGTLSGPALFEYASKGVVGASSAPPPDFTRTYHVPADLEDPSLFAKPDFVRFHKLVDNVIGTVFDLDRAKLTIGGDKGRQAARLFGLID
jgi:hypothetical protein